MAVTLGIAAQFFERRGHIGGLRRFAAVAAREGKIGFEHRLHLIDVLAHALHFRPVIEQGQFELEAREDGAQIVRDAREHRRALLHGALDVRLHLDEGIGRTPHLPRTTRPEIGHLTAFTKTFRRVGEFEDRPYLVAQEQNRGDQQDR